jgi:hypothetical protein
MCIISTHIEIRAFDRVGASPILLLDTLTPISILSHAIEFLNDIALCTLLDVKRIFILL